MAAAYWVAALLRSRGRVSSSRLPFFLQRYCVRDAATSPLRTEKAHRLDATQYAISR